VESFVVFRNEEPQQKINARSSSHIRSLSSYRFFYAAVSSFSFFFILRYNAVADFMISRQNLPSNIKPVV
jgi:hypothetical protein